MSVDTKLPEAEKPWYVYHIGLFELDGSLVYNNANAPQTYKGIAVNVCQRLRKHNQITSNGAINCKRRGGSKVLEGSRVWKPFYFISGLTEHQAKQLEISIKPEYARFRTAVLNEQKSEIRKKLNHSYAENATDLLTGIKGTYESLNMNHWTPKADLSSNTNVTIHWCLPQYRPVNSADLLPSYVQEEILTTEQKQEIFKVSDKSKPWKVQPW